MVRIERVSIVIYDTSFIGFVVVNLDDKNQIIPSLLNSSSNDDLFEQLRQLELLRLENEQLRSELNTHKTEIQVLRRERDSLVHTINKLDNELTKAESQRLPQFQAKYK